MGKTKTAFVGGADQPAPSGEEKYKQRQAKKKALEEKEKHKIEGLGLKGGERIKVIEAQEAPEVVVPVEKEDKKTKPVKARARGKRYLSANQTIDKKKSYPLAEAISLIKKASYSRFDGTMELHLSVKKTGTRATVKLPFSAGKAKKIEVADDKTIAKLKEGKVDFDVLLSTPDMMPKLIPFAKILGPKGLLPNPKNGTIIKKAEDAKRFLGNTLSIKTEKDFPLIHIAFGKVSMDDDQLLANLSAIINALEKKSIVKAFIKSTMSPAARIVI